MPHKDREAGKAYHRAYWAEHREKLSVDAARRYQANKEHRRAYTKQWLLDHPGWSKESRTRYHSAYPWRRYIKGAQDRAPKKGVAFALTETWGRETWTGLCAISGLPFDMEKKGFGPGPRSPSIDRIDPSLGYVPGNCRFILACVNSFKHEGTEAEMFEVLEAIMATRTAPP